MPDGSVQVDELITRHFRVRANTTHGTYLEIDVRSEDLSDFEVRTLAHAVRDKLQLHICKDQISHVDVVRVPTERELLVPSSN